MSVPLVGLNVRHLINFVLQTVLSDPKRYICEIFGDSTLEPHAALYGDKYLADIRQWITTTKIPVTFGYDLDPSQIPGVAISLERSTPIQSFMGDVALNTLVPREPWQRDVIVPRFAPKLVQPNEDGSYVSIHLPDDLAHPELVAPGLILRDFNGAEFNIGVDSAQNPTAIPIRTPLKNADFQAIEVISPYTDQISSEGAMLYEENVLVGVYGHADRVEALWLWAIVQWGILKYRPIFISTFGMDLSLPTAMDLNKADESLGENIWRRYISFSCKVVWNWERTRPDDIVAFILSVRPPNP